MISSFSEYLKLNEDSSFQELTPSELERILLDYVKDINDVSRIMYVSHTDIIGENDGIEKVQCSVEPITKNIISNNLTLEYTLKLTSTDNPYLLDIEDLFPNGLDEWHVIEVSIYGFVEDKLNVLSDNGRFKYIWNKKCINSDDVVNAFNDAVEFTRELDPSDVWTEASIETS